VGKNSADGVLHPSVLYKSHKDVIIIIIIHTLPLSIRIMLGSKAIPTQAWTGS